MRWQKRVKFPTVWVFVSLFRAAHVSNGSPETCLINSCQALTCSWASASSYLQNVPVREGAESSISSKFRGSMYEWHFFFLCDSLGLLLFWWVQTDTGLAVVYGTCSGLESSVCCCWEWGWLAEVPQVCFLGKYLAQVVWNPFYFVKIADINAVGSGKRQ